MTFLWTTGLQSSGRMSTSFEVELNRMGAHADITEDVRDDLGLEKLDQHLPGVQCGVTCEFIEQERDKSPRKALTF